MKKLSLLAILAIFIFACNTTENDSEQTTEGTLEKKYEIESGLIVYKSQMMGMETKISIYFKDFGNTEATRTEMEMMGQKTSTLSLHKDNFMYSYSEDMKTGTKIDLSDEKIAAEIANSKINEEAIAALGGKKTGTENILEKECDVYEVSKEGLSQKYWIWKNIVLKMIASQEGVEVKMEATELKETSNFPDGIFDIPADVKFTEPNLDTNNDFEVEGAEG